jgi:futalosine hydrolase
VHILVVAATSAEIAPFVEGLRGPSDGDARVMAYTRARHDVDVLTTGVGMVATAAWCSRVLARGDTGEMQGDNKGQYDLAINLGVCGSFTRELEPGRVVHVVTDRMPELGAEDGEAFLTIQDLKLLDNDEFPFRGGRLMNVVAPDNAVLGALPAVHGITVNTAHGNDASIATITRRCAPQVESMEGAAFMYACLIHGLPFAQVRAVSNFVERRNRGAWKIAEAIRALGETALGILDHA